MKNQETTNTMEKQFQNLQAQGYDLVTKMINASHELDEDPSEEAYQLMDMLESVKDINSNNSEAMETYIQQFETFMKTYNNNI